MADDVLTDVQRANAIAAYLNSKGASGRVSALENLTGTSDDLLLQFLMGNVDDQYLADRVFEAFYDPYTMTGDLPVRQQMMAADGIGVVGERLGLNADSVEAVLAEMRSQRITPNAANTAFQVLSRSVEYKKDDGGEFQADLAALEQLLTEFADGVVAEQQFVEDIRSGDVAFVDMRTFQEVEPEFDESGNLVNPSNVHVLSRVDPADARAELAKVGLEGVFADPDIYRGVADRNDLARAGEIGDERMRMQNEVAALQELQRQQTFALGDEFGRGVPAAEKQMEIDRAVNQARDLGEIQRRRDVLVEMGREPASQDAFQLFPEERNVLDAETVAAMAGMYNSRKPTQMSQQEYDRRQSEIDTDFADRIDQTKVQERALQELQRKAQDDAAENSTREMPKVANDFLTQLVSPVVSTGGSGERRKPKLDAETIQRAARVIANTAKIV